MKNKTLLEEPKSRFELAKERLNELEDRLLDIVKSEEQRKYNFKK